MSDQLVLAYSRDSDPASSKRAAATCRAPSQKARILAELYRYDRAFGASVATVDADRLHALWPNIQRSVLSTRLSAMRRAGLLEVDRSADPVTFRLTTEGRAEARRLATGFGIVQAGGAS